MTSSLVLEGSEPALGRRVIPLACVWKSAAGRAWSAELRAWALHTSRRHPVEPTTRRNMTSNVANIDRVIRVLIGLALFAVGIFAPLGPALQVGAFVLGTIALGTAAVGFCPLYRLFGVSTRRGAPAPPARV